MQSEKLLEVKDLETTFSTEHGKLKAVRNVSFSLKPGETLGIVGESGSGKSVTVESILQLHESNTTYNGEIVFKGENLLDYTDRKMQSIRGKEISMVFQDPMSSLNPVYTIGNQLRESIKLHQKLNNKEANKVALNLLKLTGVPDPEARLKNHPHELSGGLRQRVMIAMALSCNPALLIADEPTTALDVTIQAQILDMIDNLKKELNMGVIMITHDLAVVAEVCTHVAVMYYGQIVEQAEVKTLFDQPLHPYTMGLMKSIPRLDGDKNNRLYVIKGMVPSLSEEPKGCPFKSRCEFATNICGESMPQLEEHENGHKIRCWNYKTLLNAEEN